MKASNVADVAVAKDLKEAKREVKEEKKSDKEETKVLKETPVPDTTAVAEKKPKKEGSVAEPSKLPAKEKLVEKTEKAQKKVEKETVKAKKADNEVASLKPAVADAKREVAKLEKLAAEEKDSNSAKHLTQEASVAKEDLEKAETKLEKK